MVRFLHGTNQTETSSSPNSSTVHITQRERKNGWSCPWHPLQIIAWFFLILFAVSYFGILVFYLPIEWRPAGFIIPGCIYFIHIIVHILALSIDPADPNIRQGSHNDKGLFDRNVHAHVIENDHCRICQADVYPKSKHCSTCNKCVSDFDHHCKWLNTCVGGRNYKLFIGCIATAFVGALTMSVVTLYLFVSFFTAKQSLLNSQNNGKFNLFAPVSDTVFVVFIGINEALYLLAIGLLGHLLGFHIYLMYLNLSTYEYIVNARDRKPNDTDEANCERGTPMNLQRFRNNKVQPSPEAMENGELSVESNNRVNSTSTVEQSESTVKVMNEISSKVAKRNSTNALYTNHHASLDDSSHPTENNIPQESSSCESLRENTQDTLPAVTVHLQSEKLKNGRQQDNAKEGHMLENQDNDNQQARSKEGHLELEQKDNDKFPAKQNLSSENFGDIHQSKTKQFDSVRQNGNHLPFERQVEDNQLSKPREASSESEGEELVPLETLPPQQNRQEKKPKKKRKKNSRKTEGRALPPLRPLPTLSSYNDSPC